MKPAINFLPFKNCVLIVLMTISFGAHVRGQERDSDSLISVLKISQEDTNKVKTLNALAFAIRNNSQQDSCIALSKRALTLSQKLSLHQTKSDYSTKDGMDIALCSVIADKRIVKYAGANRPLWIIRKGQSTVEEIKATKKAIGGFTEEGQYFETHEIELGPGDTFYITTDGYADTFSSEDKKLTTKKFKQLLLEIQDKSMLEQEKHLDEFAENWRGKTEQVDDILVIGVRL